MQSRQRQAPPRPRASTPPASDEEYEAPAPVPNKPRKKVPLQERQAPQRRPPTPTETDEEYEAPAPVSKEPHKKPPGQRQAPQRKPPTPPAPDEEYEAPAPMPQGPRTKKPAPVPQEASKKVDEYLEPEEGEWSGPTDDYSEIPTGMDMNHKSNAPPPPQLPDHEPAQESQNMSSLQKEILEKKLKKSTRELPETPTQEKAIKGFQMVRGLNSVKIRDAKGGLRKVGKTSVEQEMPKCESSGPDLSDSDFKAKAAMFGTKVLTNAAPRQPSPRTIVQEDKPSPHSSTNNNSSNRSDSSVDVRDGRHNSTPEQLAPPIPTPRKSPLSRPQPDAPTSKPTSNTQLHQPSPRTIIQEDKPSPRSSTNSNSSNRNDSSVDLRDVGHDNTPEQLAPRPQPDAPTSKPTSNTQILSSCPWYFGGLVREEAISKLLAMGEDGAYLVRDSTKDPIKPYTLSLFFKKVWHLHIRIRPDGMFALGFEKRNEEHFANVPELIDYYTQHSVLLVDTGERGTRLIKHV